MNRKQLAALLLAAALFDAVVLAGFWAVKGAHTGWTRTQVEVVTLDEVTGLEARAWEARFVPGIEFLGAGLFSAIAMAGVALFLRRTTNAKTDTH